jgi:hypothetical protein
MQTSLLPISSRHEPKVIDPEAGEQLLFEALAQRGDPAKRAYFERKWMELLCQLDEGDEMVLFETSGVGSLQRRGLARSRGGEVVDVLMLP